MDRIRAQVVSVSSSRQLALAALLSLAFAASFPSKALACVCRPLEPPCQAFWTAEVVFVGKVTAITSGSEPLSKILGYYGPTEVLLQVEKSFKGSTGETVTLFLADDSCQYHRFDVGGRYLVYAYKDQEGNLTTSLCSRTRLVEQSSEDLVYIRGFRNRPPGSWIYGTMAHGATEELAAEAKVTVKGENTERVTQTDAEGNYLFLGLSPGRYVVSAETNEPVSWEVEVHDRGCAELSLPFWYVRELLILSEDSKP